MKKSFLVVYPHNCFDKNSGINTRYYELLKYFQTRNIKVDMFALKNFESPWADASYKNNELIDEIFFYDFAKGFREQKYRKNKRVKIFKKFLNKPKVNTLPDFAFNSMKEQFKEILAKKKYDQILISYVYWANLVDNEILDKYKFILEISDFLTLNLFDANSGQIKIGDFIEEEIRRIQLFKKIFCISEDERFFFSQFIPSSEFYYIPFFMKSSYLKGNVEPEFDILFIGSDNPHNRKGIEWFFKSVYPLINKSCKILIVGKVCNYIGVYNNVTTLSFQENLEDVYKNTKLSICPLLGGTGMKIKVVEALSYGLPVVTTRKGIVGFPSKSNTGCIVVDNADQFAESINSLLNNKDDYEKYRKLAINFFNNNFNKNKIYKDLDRMFNLG